MLLWCNKLPEHFQESIFDIIEVTEKYRELKLFRFENNYLGYRTLLGLNFKTLDHIRSKKYGLFI